MNKIAPILTIIIPHYNIPGLLKRLLDTIPDNDDIQIIVIDDNSTEQLDVYNRLKADYSHVTFINNDGQGKGGGAARNIGLKHAAGEWILFADADDIFIEGFYDEVSKWFICNADIVFFPPISVYENSGKDYEPISLYRNYIKDYQRTGLKKEENILRYMWHTPWSRLIRKEIIVTNSIQFVETSRYNDSYFAITASFYAKQIAISDKKIYKQIIRPNLSGTAQTRPVRSKDIAKLFVDERIRKYNFLRSVLPKEEFIVLPLHGILIVLYILLEGNPPHSRFSLRNIPLAFYALKMCKKNRVKLFHKNFFNNEYIRNMYTKWYNRKKNMKKIKYY